MMWTFLYKNCIWLSVLWALVILGLCSMPGQYVPSVSWLEMLSFDKWVHASIFFVLCILLFSVAIRKRSSFIMVLFYFVMCVAYGGLLEIMQAKLFSNRSADWQDFVANSFGCVTALLLYKKLRTKVSPSF